MAKIKNTDLFEKDLFKPTIKEIESFLEVLKKVKGELMDLAKVQQKTAKDNAGKNRIKNVKELTNAEIVLTKIAKEKQKLEQNEIKFQKILDKSYEEELKRKRELQKANRELNKQLDAEITFRAELDVEIKNNADAIANLDRIEQKEVKTKKQALELNKALRQVVNGLDATIEEEADAIRRLNAVIDKNTDFVKENSDTNVQNKINVGNYKESVKEALAETDAFNGILGELGDTGGKIVAVIRQQAQAFKDQAEALKESGQEVKGLRKAFRGLNNVFKASIIGAIAIALLSIGKALSQSREATIEFQVRIAQLNNTLRLVGGRLIEVGKIIFNIYAKGFQFLGRTFKELQVQFLEFKNSFEIEPKNIEIYGKTINIFEGISFASEESKDKLAKLKGELEAEPDVGFLDVFNELISAPSKIADAFDGLGDSLGSTNTKLEEALRIQERLKDVSAVTEKKISDLTGEIELLQIVADDTTRSFLEQERALEQIAVKQKQRADLELGLAQERFEVAKRLAEIDLEASGVVATEEQLRTLSFLEDQNKALKLTDDTLALLKEAVAELDDVETKRFFDNAERSRKQREIERDAFEQQLDFAIDIFDNQKTINEQLIADETKTFEERFQILRKTQKLNESSFDSQIELTEEVITKLKEIDLQEELRAKKLADRSIKNKNLTEEELVAIRKRAEASTEELNLREIASLEDEKVIRQRLKNGEIDENVNKRILEIIRERKTFNQDLLVSERELGEAFEENARRSVEARRDLREFQREVAVDEADELFQIQKDIFDKTEEFEEEAFNKAIERSEDLTDAELKELEQRTLRELAQLGQSEEEKNLIRAKAQKEKEDIIKEGDKREQELIKEANAKRLEATKETAQKIDEVLGFFEDKQRERFEERISNIDKEIQASKDRENDLKEIARQGTLDANENLAFEQRKQAELEKEKEREQKRQERRELGFTALKTYTAKVEAGSKNPLQETLQDITLLLAAIETASFFEGSDHVEKDLNPQLNTGKDDYVIRVDGSEKVFKPEHSKRIGYGMSNEEVVQIVERFKKGELFNDGIDRVILGTGYQSNDAILSKFDELKNSIESLPQAMPRNDIKYDPIERAVVTIQKDRNKIIRTHTKQGGIW